MNRLAAANGKGRQALVYLGLGANLGDREQNLAVALECLLRHAVPGEISRLYETEPVGLLEQPRFLNLVCSAKTTIEPEELRCRLKEIEAAMGRDLHNPERNAPRPIDLDILLYDERLIATPTLTVPHPELARRAFVLAPMCDLAPGLKHPVLGKTMAELLSEVGTAGIRALPPAELRVFQPLPESGGLPALPLAGWPGKGAK